MGNIGQRKLFSLLLSEIAFRIVIGMFDPEIDFILVH